MTHTHTHTCRGGSCSVDGTDDEDDDDNDDVQHDVKNDPIVDSTTKPQGRGKGYHQTVSVGGEGWGGGVGR